MIECNHQVIEGRVSHAALHNTTFFNESNGLVLEQKFLDAETYDKLCNLSDRFTSDDAQKNTFIAAVTYALTTLDEVCKELGFDLLQYRNAWKAKGLVSVIDTNRLNNNWGTETDKLILAAQEFIEKGRQRLDRLPREYSSLAENLSTQDTFVLDTNMFIGVYGSILHSGYSILSIINDVARAQSADLDAEFKKLYGDPPELLQPVGSTNVNKQVVHDLNSEITRYEQQGVETYINEKIEEFRENNEEILAVFTILAFLATYSDGESLVSPLNEHGNILVRGIVLGLTTAQKIASYENIDFTQIINLIGQSELSKIIVYSDEDESVMKKILKDDIESLVSMQAEDNEYDEFLHMIAIELGLQGDREKLFHAGFLYILDLYDTYKTNIIDKIVAKETVDIDQKLGELLNGD